MSAQIEFLSLVENTLLGGNVACISVLQELYNNILSANNFDKPQLQSQKIEKAPRK